MFSDQFILNRQINPEHSIEEEVSQIVIRASLPPCCRTNVVTVSSLCFYCVEAEKRTSHQLRAPSPARSDCGFSNMSGRCLPPPQATVPCGLQKKKKKKGRLRGCWSTTCAGTGCPNPPHGPPPNLPAPCLHALERVIGRIPAESDWRAQKSTAVQSGRLSIILPTKLKPGITNRLRLEFRVGADINLSDKFCAGPGSALTGRRRAGGPVMAKLDGRDSASLVFFCWMGKHQHTI